MPIDIDLWFGLVPTCAIACWIALSCGYFFLWGRKKLVDPRHSGFFYQFWPWLMTPVARAINALGGGPNHVTLASFLLAALTASLFASGYLLAASWMLTAAVSCDTVDGFLARLQGSSSRAGAFLDSFLDRLSEGVILSGIAYLGRGEALCWLALFALVASFAVSYARARGEALGADDSFKGVMQRSERAAILIMCTFFAGFGPWAGEALGLGGYDGRVYLYLAMGLTGVGATVTAIRRARSIYALLADLERAS